MDAADPKSSPLLQPDVQRLEASLRANPQNPAVMAQLAEAWLQAGPPGRARAEALMQRLDQLRALSGELVHRLAQQLLVEGQPSQAFEWLKKTRMDPRGKELLNRAADQLEQDGRFDEAAGVLRYINEHDWLLEQAAEIRRRELEISTELELAELHYKTGRYAQAFDQCVRVLRMGLEDIGPVLERIEAIVASGQPFHSAHLLWLAEFFHARGEEPRTLAYLNKLWEIDPEFARQSPSAKPIVEALLRRPSLPPGQSLALGTLCLRMERIDEAIARFQEAGAQPDLAVQANRGLAGAYARAGRCAEALEKYRFLPLETADLEGLYELQKRLADCGASADAMQALALIQRANPAYRDVPQRIAEMGVSVGGESLQLGDPKMHALIGDLAGGRYRYIRQIGSGGMGVVHEVFDSKNNRPAAMKILREGLAGNVKALTRFFREAEYLDQLNHPNIVRIYDFNISRTAGQSFIAMEMVDGPSLRQILEERPREEAARDYTARVLGHCLQLCDALEAAHQAGVTHRDIKPDNVMINSQGVVKITDFGILHADEGADTPTGAMIGTPRYMAPEQVSGGTVDGRCDIYAVGILLYEMLTGSPPFTSGDIAYQQIHVGPTPPGEVASSIPPSLSRLIMKCLDKDPNRRCQSAAELKKSLQEELRALAGTTDSRPAEAGPDPPAQDIGLGKDADEFD